MRLSITDREAFVEVSVTGPLGTEDLPAFREEMDHLLAMKRPRVLWDLERSQDWSIGVFGEFARALVITHIRKGVSALLSPPGSVEKHLQGVGLRAVATVFRDRESALALVSPLPKERSRSEFVASSLLGEILCDLNVLSEEGLRMALDEQKRSGSDERLGAVLLRLGIVTPAQLLGALETQYRRRGGVPSAATGATAARAAGLATDRGGRSSAKSEFVKKGLLGEILLELGVIDEAGLRRALQVQRGAEGEEKLGDILLRLGIVTPEDVMRALETQANRKG